MAGMKRSFWLSIAIPLASSALLAQAPPRSQQTTDKGWSRVLELAQGDEITVKTARTGNLRCNFTGATDSELYCELRAAAAVPLIGGRKYAFARAEIIKVRRRHFNRNFKATVAASAGIGCALGWVSGGPIGCLAVGFGGALVGGVLGITVWYWLPGNVIYENREAHSKKQPPNIDSVTVHQDLPGAGATTSGP